MSKTELIIYHRPNKGITLADSSYDNAYASAFSATGSNYTYRTKDNPNETISKVFQSITRPSSKSSGGLTIDLYDNVNIPITYNILDIREPEKRKTSWSKTITIPGTKNNNRVFGHIYEISQDGWVTIGNTSVYEGFNPNIRKEIVLLNDGIQILKGNLQLKKLYKTKNGDIEYEVALTGELTSLFYDVGDAKLSDLDWTEWDHYWNQETIKKSWGGICTKNGVDYPVITDSSSGGSIRTISNISRDPGTGRIRVTTTSAQSWDEGDWVRINLTGGNTSGVNAYDLRWVIGSSNWYQSSNSLEFGYGNDYQIAEVHSTTQFSVNWPYPLLLPNGGVTINNTPIASTVVKRTSSGRGYVYPMVSWGEEYGSKGYTTQTSGGSSTVDSDSFPVTSFVPGFYAKEIWDKIMKDTNSRYQSNFLDSEFFKRLIIIQKKSSYDLNPAEYNGRKFQVGTTQSYTTLASAQNPQNSYWPQYGYVGTTATSSMFPKFAATNVPFNAETGASGTASFFDNGVTDTDATGNWDENTYKWIVRDTGEYDLTCNVKLSSKAIMNGLYVSNANNSNTADGTASLFPTDPYYKYYPKTQYAAASKLEAVVTIWRRRSGVVTDIGSTIKPFEMNGQSYWNPANSNWTSFGVYQPFNWINQSVTVTSTSKYFNTGDEVWVEVKYNINKYGVSPARIIGFSLSNPNARYLVRAFSQLYSPPYDPMDPQGSQPVWTDIMADWFLTVEGASYIFNDPSPSSSENSLIEAQSFLPKDMSCKDFLLSIIKMFNLHIQEDAQTDKYYTIEPRDDFYRDGSSPTHFEDWTYKIDNESVDITPIGELGAKYYKFENIKETDYWNKKFLEDRGRDYMSYTKEIQNDFLKNEIKISVPLGSTVMVNQPQGSDVVIPAVLQVDNNGTAKPMSNSKARMLIWGGLKPYTADRGGDTTSYWEFVSSANLVQAGQPLTSIGKRSYPYAGTVDSPVDPIYDINWYNMEEGDFVYWDWARWTNGNLYNRFWKNMMLEISDPASKVVSADLDLKPTDIFELDFRKVYVIDGHWLRLQKIIDYDPIGGGLTKCEFLKLRAPSKFKLRSVGPVLGTAPASFYTELDNTGPITVVNTELPPRRRKETQGWTNVSPDSFLGNNNTIETNGSSNHVSKGSKNIKINGDENAIGNNCSNVSVSGGNGNFILGGLNNVNIIGTDKKIVKESDVTYINGIRYKNGIAISRSNVITAGLDVANIRQSDSTTSNVISAGEDVVIQAGSTTYENVINPGMDEILPDVPELGLGTSLNPNPRTNLSGGFNITSPTASQITIIREASRSRS